MSKIEKLINTASEEQLRQFAVQYAGRDGNFANALSVRFAVPEVKAEADKIANAVELALDGVDDYRRYDSWGYVDVDLREVDYEITQRINQGQFKVAFAQAAAAYSELLEVFEFQGECEIADEAESFIQYMEQIAASGVSAEDGEYIFNRAIELAHDDTGSDYGADYEDRFLKIAANFVTRDNRAKFDKSLDEFSAGWRGGAFAVIKLTAIRRLDGDVAADAFIAGNLKYDEIRKIAYDNAMSAQRYEVAAQLCIDAQIGDDGRNNLTWTKLLFSAYESQGDMRKMAEIAETLTLSGLLDYYDKLKSLHIELADWDAFYPEMLSKCVVRLHSESYMQILSKEGELARLLEQAKSSPRSIYTYGKQLAVEFPEGVDAIFVDQLNKEADEAHSRTGYSYVCSHIKTFFETGYENRAKTLIETYKVSHKRQPAFVDELRKIETELGLAEKQQVASLKRK